MIVDGQYSKKKRSEGIELLSLTCGAEFSDNCLKAANVLLVDPTLSDTSRAIMLFKRACDANRQEACAPAGLLSVGSRSNLLPADVLTQLLASACKFGSGPACGHVAARLLAGGDREGARVRAAAGCEKTDGRACGILGGEFEMMVVGATAEVLRSARAHLQVACQAGFPERCLQLGELLSSFRGGPQDLAGALQNVERACTGNLPSACVERDRLEALKSGQAPSADVLHRFTVACGSGDARACFITGEFTLRAPRVSHEDESRAAASFLRACKLDLLEACNSYADLLYNGRGVEHRDRPAALRMYAEACAKGAQIACTNQARMIWKGEETTKDFARALSMLMLACDEEYLACETASQMYDRGDGTPKDRDASKKYADRACAIGSPERRCKR
jgi:TPR repeat protein